MSMNTSIEVSNTVLVFDILLKHIVYHIPLVFVIFGFIGFLGNVLTFLDHELRTNTCCIYSLCGSFVDFINLFLNLLPVYLNKVYGLYVSWLILPNLCKFMISMFGFIPNLSINFLLMSIIDRYACTCPLRSYIRRINQLKMVPWLIGLSIIFSGVTILRGILLYEFINGIGCVPIYPLTNNILYIVINGVIQPVAMLLFVLLTYRNVRNSRQRVGGAMAINPNRSRKQFITMVFTQVIATAFISLQWMIMFTYFIFTINDRKSIEQLTIINFFYTLTNYCYYLNNVKSFYISLLTSRLFRQTFLKTLSKILPRRIYQRWQISQGNISTVAGTKVHRQPTILRQMATEC